MEEKILEALSQLDPLDDDHWTADGAPRVDVVENIVGEDVKRQDIVNADPEFNRAKASKVDNEKGAEEVQGEVTESVEALAAISRPLTEREFATFLSDVPKGDLDDIEAMLKIQLEEVQLDLTKIKDLEGRIKNSLSMTSSRIKREFPNSSETDAIRSFIKNQTEQRAAKVARRQEILKGINIKDLDPRAPIDAAMARKTKRGASRPVRPLVK